MALILALSALAVFVPSTSAQSSDYLNASSGNITATVVSYPLSNITLSHGPTATAVPSGFITSYADAGAIDSPSAVFPSFITSSIGNPASAVESAEGSCGQATVTETAYQTVTVTATPTIAQDGDDPAITEASAADEPTSHTFDQVTTSYLTHTLRNANATGVLGNSTDGAGSALPTGARLGRLKSHRRGHYAGL